MFPGGTPQFQLFTPNCPNYCLIINIVLVLIFRVNINMNIKDKCPKDRKICATWIVTWKKTTRIYLSLHLLWSVRIVIPISKIIQIQIKYILLEFRVQVKTLINPFKIWNKIGVNHSDHQRTLRNNIIKDLTPKLKFMTVILNILLIITFRPHLKLLKFKT